MRKIGKKEGQGIRNIKKPDLKGKASSLLFALLALALTILVFGVLLFLQNIFKEDITYKEVLIAKTDIPENEIITEANVSSYFERKEMNILDTMNGCINSVDSIIGTQSKVFLYKGEIITEKDFRNVSQNVYDFNNPVEISIDVGAAANADGGKIRAGDTVNINMMFTRNQLGLNNSLKSVTSSVPDIQTYIQENLPNDDMEELFSDESEFEEPDDSDEEDMQEIAGVPITLTEDDLISVNGPNSDYTFDYYAEYILQDVHVTKVLDASGAEISPTDTSSVASILVFTIEKEQELAINNALANCANIRVSKVVYKTVSSAGATLSNDETDTNDVEDENE